MFTVKLLCKVQISNWSLIQLRCLYENHYEILKLKSNCSNKEIRSAFIKLSKECHPDKLNGTDSHDKYVRIVEAYTILKNPDSRADYDLGLRVPNKSTSTSSRPYRTYYYYDDPVKRAWSDHSYYTNRSNSHQNVNRQTNKELIYAVGTMMIVVLLIYFVTIWKFFTNGMVQVDAETAKNFALLREIRAQSEGKDNNQRVVDMVEKMKRSD